MFAKHWGKITLVVILAVIVGFTWYADENDSQANEGVTIAANLKGNPEGAVSLVKYSDFQCPACAASVPAVNQLLEQYGDDIRFEYRHFPLMTIHPLAIPAARAAEAAGQQGAFWGMHDLLFENQDTWSTAGNPSSFFRQYAETLELDVAQFERQLNASRIEEHIQTQFTEARQQGFTGTPTFVLNGEQMEFNSYQEFASQVEAAVLAATGGAPANSATATPATSTPSAADVGVEFGV